MSNEQIWATLYHRQTSSEEYKNHVHPRIRRANKQLFSEHLPTNDTYIDHYWEIVPVSGKIEDDAFFFHIRNGRFPVNQYLRNEQELEYLPLRDMWHDMFGHLGILTYEKYSNYLSTLAYLWWLVEGRTNEKYVKDLISRLYWLTAEFGMIQIEGKRYAYGAGIVSSINELKYAVHSEKPHRRYLRPDPRECSLFIRKELQHVAPHYEEFQAYYLTISSFDVLPELARQLLPLI